MLSQTGRRAAWESLKILLPLLLLALLHWNRQIARNWRVSLPTNTYCQDAQDPGLCEAGHRAEHFMILYYDGLPHAFAKLLLEKLEDRTHTFLRRVRHRGISDSVPAFYTYFAGDLPKNYDVSFQNIDSLFRQFQLAAKTPQTFIYPKQIQVFEDSYRQANIPEARDVAYSLSPHFLEWDLQFARNHSSPQTEFPSFAAALSYLDQKLDEKSREIQPKVADIHQDLRSFLVEHPNSFLYVPDVDDLSHNVTVLSQKYLDSVACLLANLRILAEYVLAESPQMVLFFMSDHGADESRAQQERFNHETPLNPYNNSAFLGMVGRRVHGDAYNRTLELDSQEVGNFIGFHVQNVNTLVAGNLRSDLFVNDDIRQAAFQSRKKSLDSLESQFTESSGVEGRDPERSPLRPSTQKAPNQSTQSTVQPSISKRARIPDPSSRLGQLRFFCFLLTLLLAVSSFFGFSSRLKSLEKHCVVLIFGWVAILGYFAVRGEFLESHFPFWYFGLLILVGIVEYRQTLALDQWFWLKQGMPLLAMALWRLGLHFENQLFDSESLIGFLVSAWVVLVFARRHIPSVRLGSSSRMMVWGHRAIAFLTIFYDSLIPLFGLPLSHPVLPSVAVAGHAVFSLVVASGLLASQTDFPRTLGVLTLQFVFWTSTAADKLLIFSLFEVSSFLFRQAKLQSDKPQRLLELLFRTFPLFLAVYLMQGYRFDWKNRIRMAPKLEAAPLYRNSYLLAAAGSLLVAGSKLDALEEINCVADFTFGLLFAVVAQVVPQEYRMQAAKMSEAFLLCYLPLKAAYFRGLFQKFLDSRRQTLRIHTIVAQKLSNKYRRTIEL